MNRTEVRTLLEFIEGFERRSFPSTATDAWLAIMARTELADAMQAVTEFFDQPEPAGAVQPGPIRRRAALIRETRERRAIGPVPNASPPNETYLRARAQLARRLGDPNRELARRPPARADTSTPTTSDSGVTDAARLRSLAALRSYAAA